MTTTLLTISESLKCFTISYHDTKGWIATIYAESFDGTRFLIGNTVIAYADNRYLIRDTSQSGLEGSDLGMGTEYLKEPR